jgi:hypothetical protein
MTNGSVFATIARKDTVEGSQPLRHTTIQRLAANLSRLNVDQATTELLNSAHCHLIELCYQRDETGHLVNVDPATGKVLVPLCWGKKGHAKWGLTSTEANAMRRIMFARMRDGVPLFFFERSRRAWYVDLGSYAAMPVVAEWEIRVVELRLARGR